MTDEQASDRAVTFIREDDRTSDRFGGHTRLADAMRRALEMTPHLEAVGLFGAWGSGKSTVIRMLETRMASPTTRFFTFDAWVHQSDAPRRAFLEAFIRFLDREGLADSNALEVERVALLTKLETVEVETEPRLSIRGGFALSLLLVAPVAAAFLKEGWAVDKGDYYFETEHYEFNSVFWAALVLATAPFLGLLGLTAYRLVQRLRGKKTNPALAQLFTNKATEFRTDSKKTSPEPTALEFQRTFRHLLELVEAEPGRRLIFVVDNLDRLPEPEMMSLWSNVRSLFHGERSADAPPLPTVVVPMDFDAVRRAHTNHKDAEAVAQGFADKTFDVVFRLPGPVTSLWQDYLRRRLEEAFGADLPSDWGDVAARVLEAGAVESRLPRAINIFVNDIAALWLQWREHGVSFAAMAYYAAKRGDFSEGAWPVLRQPVPWMTFFDEDWARGVAAIHYGALPEVAGQILIEQPLRDAITKNVADQFDELAERDGFIWVLLRLLQPLRTQQTGLPPSHAANLLARLPNQNSPNLKEAWSCVAISIAITDSWSPASAADVRAVESLFEHLDRADRGVLQQSLRGRLSRLSGDWFLANLETTTDVVAIAQRVAEADGARGLEPFSLPGSAGLALTVAGGGAARTALFATNLGTQPLGDELLSAVGEGRMPMDLAPTIDGLSRWLPDMSWAQMARAAAERLPKADARDGNRFIRLIATIWRTRPETRSDLSAVASESAFAVFLIDALRTHDDQIAGLLTALGLISKPTPQWLEASWAKAPSYTEPLLSSIDAHLADLAPELTLDDLARHTGGLGVLRSVLMALVRSRLKANPRALSITAVASRLNLYVGALDQPQDRAAWTELTKRKAFWEALARAEDNLGGLDQARFLLKVAADTQQSRAVAFLASRIETLTPEERMRGIRFGEEIYDAMEITLARPAPFGWSVERALIDAVEFLAKDPSPAFATRWFKVAARLDPVARARVSATLANALASQSDAHLPPIFGAAPADFFDLLFSSERVDLSVGTMMAGAIRDLDNVVWLAEAIHDLAQRVSQASPLARAKLEAAIMDARLERRTAAQTDAFKRVAAAWAPRLK